MSWFKRKEKPQAVAAISSESPRNPLGPRDQEAANARAAASKSTNLYPAPTLSQAWLDRSAPAEDRRTDLCPNCGGKLKKVPGAKTKCPHCGRPMYVRVDPRINATVVVTEAELEGIDDANAVAYGTWEERRQDKIHRAAARERLRQKFGSTPDEADVNWQFLNEKFLNAVAHDDGYVIFTVAGEMTEQLMREKKYADAVHMVARVIVNLWVDEDHNIPPAWTAVIEKAAKNGVSLDDARTAFIEGARGLHAIPRYRVNAAEVWESVIAQVRL